MTYKYMMQTSSRLEKVHYWEAELVEVLAVTIYLMVHIRLGN